jgi:DNA-directed RNA polymerase subunit RPC12/RpoP
MRATEKEPTVPVVKVRCGLQISPTYYYFKISSLETIHDETGNCPNCGKNVTLQVVPGRKVAPQETLSALKKLIKIIVINLGGAALFILFLYMFSAVVVRNTIPVLTSIIAFLVEAFAWLLFVPFGLAIGAAGFALVRISDNVKKDGLLHQIFLRYVPDKGKIFCSFGHKVDEIEPFVKWVPEYPEYQKTVTVHCRKEGASIGVASSVTSSGNTTVFTFTLGGPSIARVEERMCPSCKSPIFFMLHKTITLLDVKQVNKPSKVLSTHTLEP